MTQWDIKNLSELTGVSVQTLQRYNRMGLLKPSLRLSNGDRLYSESDLLRLQQIIAFKFFEFELYEIKEFINNDAEVAQHFTMQAGLLSTKESQIMEANKTLKAIISEIDYDQPIPWETIVKLIDVYNMTEQLENLWLKNIFTRLFD